MLNKSVHAEVFHLLYGMYVYSRSKLDTWILLVYFFFLIRLVVKKKFVVSGNIIIKVQMVSYSLLIVVIKNEQMKLVKNFMEFFHLPICLIHLQLLLRINKICLVSLNEGFSSILIINNFLNIDAIKPADIIQKLGMNELSAKHKWYIQPACAVTGDGLIESMLEMSNLIKQQRKESYQYTDENITHSLYIEYASFFFQDLNKTKTKFFMFINNFSFA